MNFNSKAVTLQMLEDKISTATVFPQYCFVVSTWLHDESNVIKRFFEACSWSQGSLIVRSSSLSEDSESKSLAGCFQSILNVNGCTELISAINEVIGSFDSNNDTDQVFIQPMLENVLRSGVVFTKDPTTGSPYYVINYSQSGSTQAITSGVSNDHVCYMAKLLAGENELGVDYEGWLKQVVELCQELESLYDNHSLDIEFGFNHQGELFLFQVRPLVAGKDVQITREQHQQLLYSVHRTIKRITKPHPYLNGSHSVLGVMPDWNPAEIIGIRPKPLSLSLYKELVTDSIWAYQRNNYGYKQLRSFPLLVSLSGLPYVDVRVSFNSFIPADISDELAEKLVNYYIEQLRNSPEKQDKVEFDIIFSCFTLDVEKRLEKLKAFNFNQKEIEVLTNSLRNVTNNIISPAGLWVKDSEKINRLPARRRKIVNSDLTKVEKIYWLLEDCKRYGTLPFAGLARAGFIAVQFLKSLVSEQILTQCDYENFMRSLETVSSTMNCDRSKLPFNEFLAKYGHLRPGTYDILSPRYDQAADCYFDAEVTNPTQENSENFVLSLKQLEQLKASLDSHGIEHDVISLFKFIKEAIEGREFSKFVFTQSLSDTIQLLEQMGSDFGIDKNDMSFLDVSDLCKAYSNTDDIGLLLQNSIAKGKASYKDAKSLVLPPLIVNADDIFCFNMLEGQPNYITLGKVVAQTSDDLQQTENLHNKIVFIPSADPGFDWLFSHAIAGLVTKYGGANSHMAIRAGEMGIPSVIGAGEVLYDKWLKADVLDIDAANKMVVVTK